MHGSQETGVRTIWRRIADKCYSKKFYHIYQYDSYWNILLRTHKVVSILAAVPVLTWSGAGTVIRMSEPLNTKQKDGPSEFPFQVEKLH